MIVSAYATFEPERSQFLRNTSGNGPRAQDRSQVSKPKPVPAHLMRMEVDVIRATESPGFGCRWSGARQPWTVVSISRDDSSLPSFRMRLSQATRLPAAVVLCSWTCSDSAFSSRNPAGCQISTRLRRGACRVTWALSRHENCRFDEHGDRCRRFRAKASVTAFPKAPELEECLPAARCGCCLPYPDVGP